MSDTTEYRANDAAEKLIADLRAALRSYVIQGDYCHHCDRIIWIGDHRPEAHAKGCLAALPRATP